MSAFDPKRTSVVPYRASFKPLRCLSLGRGHERARLHQSNWRRRSRCLAPRRAGAATGSIPRVGVLMSFAENDPDAREFRVGALIGQLQTLGWTDGEMAKPQLSRLITSQWCFETSAAAIVGQNHAWPLLDMIALKRRTVASAPRCASHSRRMRVTLSRISSFRA